MNRLVITFLLLAAAQCFVVETHAQGLRELFSSLKTGEKYSLKVLRAGAVVELTAYVRAK